LQSRNGFELGKFEPEPEPELETEDEDIDENLEEELSGADLEEIDSTELRNASHEFFQEKPRSQLREFLDGFSHALVSTIWFILISLLAASIDLSLHWFEGLQFVEKYGLSRLIRGVIECTAGALALADSMLFCLTIYEPVVKYVRRWIGR
jgi:ABC-type phosphate transport system permease subunit